MRKASEFERLFGKHIKRACELGAIGLQALEPKNLSKYFADSSNIKLVKPDLSRKKNETVILLNLSGSRRINGESVISSER